MSRENIFNLIHSHIYVILIAVFVVLVILFPLLNSPGLLFLPDMVLPDVPTFAKSTVDGIGPTFVVDMILLTLAKLFSVSVAQKFLMLMTLLVPFVATYAFLVARKIEKSYAVAGGMIMLYSPFVYERFMAGQWFVILGAAYIPVVFLLLERYRKVPTERNFLKFALAYAVYPLLSLHFAYITAILLSVYVVVDKLLNRFFSPRGSEGGIPSEHMVVSDVKNLTLSPRKNETLRHLMILIGLTLIINVFWLPSFFAPSRTYHQIDQTDFSAYATVGDEHVGIFLNVLSLYGFWGEGILTPKDTFSLWWVPTLFIALFALFGVIYNTRKKDPLAITLLVLFLPLLILAVGYGNPLTTKVTEWVMRVVPGFRGLRETAKIVGVFVFLYAVYAPIGMRLCGEFFWKHNRMMRYVLAFALAFLGFASSFTFVNAGSGLLQMHTYPASWHGVDISLGIDTNRKHVIAFPWRSYMQFAWAGDRVISNPAKNFFSFPVLINEATPNVRLLAKDQDPTTRMVEELLDLPETRAKGYQYFKTNEVTNIIVFKEGDWQRYADFLSDNQYYERIVNYPEIAVYRLR